MLNFQGRWNLIPLLMVLVTVTTLTPLATLPTLVANDGVIKPEDS